MNLVMTHPKLVTLGIVLAVPFVVGTAIGMVDHNQVFAIHQHNHASQSST